MLGLLINLQNTYPIAPTCSYMALYVEDVLRGCPQDVSSGTGRIRGQTFDSDNYNIIVRISLSPNSAKNPVQELFLIF